MNRHGISLLLLLAAAPAAPTVELLQATYFGTASDDDLQGGAPGTDGSIYIAGNTGLAMTNFPVTRFGTDDGRAQCGHGFVLRLSADGQKVLAYAEFGAGIASVTTVQVNDRGVYVAGYATEHLAPLLANVPGLMRAYPLAKDVTPIQADNSNEAGGVPKDGREMAHLPQPKAAGAPFVVRLSAELKTIEAGTYLEGWQQVWPKARYIPRKTVLPVSRPFSKNDGFWKCWPTEFTWHPTFVQLLKDGDVVVGHDGGYSRALTKADRQLAKTVADSPLERTAGGASSPTNASATGAASPAQREAKLLDRLGFYNVCDYVSRLSPDLDKRVYRQDIYTPATDPAVSQRLKDGWPYAHYGNPRTHQLRVDQDDQIYLAGWAASATSQEPWWSPYLWKLQGRDGSVVWKAYEYDPMSGAGNRLGGTVADTGLSALALDGRGNVVVALLSDGGNNVMSWSPRAVLGAAFEGPAASGRGFSGGLVHFHGQVHRLDAQSRVGLVRTRIGPWGWVTDLAVGNDDNVLAIGRCNYDFRWTPDAWQAGEKLENPVGWFRLYSPTLELTFSTALRGVWPRALVPLPRGRYLVVGESKGVVHRIVPDEGNRFEIVPEPNPGLAPAKNALFAKPVGQSDGYWMIIEGAARAK